MRQIVRCLVLALPCAAAFGASPPEPVALAALRAHLDFLASDALEGRDTGARGHELAALYAAAQFRQWGLAPGSGDSYLQPVPLVDLARAGSSFEALGPAGAAQLVGKDDYLLSARGSEEEVALEADLVFAGFGIDADGSGRSDYAGLEVAGKVVLVLSGAPPGLPSEIRAHFASGRAKRAEAARRGAVALLTLKTRDDERRSPWERALLNADRPSTARAEPDGRVVDDAPGLRLTGSLSQAGARKLLAGSGVTVEQLLDLGDSGGAGSRALGVRARLAVSSTVRRYASPNVVALLAGGDPALAGELVVVSAHLDHVGIGAEVEGDAIYNGFYDNALGSAMVLELARLLARAEPRPRRSVAFLLVTAEERGLLGSEFFAAHPSVTGAPVVANLNLDMPLFLHPVADVVAFGAEHSTLGPLARAAIEAHGFAASPDPEPEESIFVRSDQYSFVRRGVPAIYLDVGFRARDGSEAGRAAAAAFRERHYHRPSDEADLGADWDGVARFTAAAHDLVRAIADAPERPRWLPDSFFGRLFGGE
jgi:hypothetical protein